MKTIALRGPFYEPNSHAGTCRSLAIALHRAGAKVRSINCPSGMWKNAPLKVRKEEAEILTAINETPLSPKEYLLIQHLVPNQFIYDPGASLNIGYVSIETERVHPAWLLPMQGMDCLWTPSTHNLERFVASGITRNIYSIPHGVDPTIFCPQGDKFDYGDKIKFGCCFDWTPRKNGVQTIIAVLDALKGREDCCLVLKVYFKNPGEEESLKEFIKQTRAQMGIREHPQVILHSEIVPDVEMGKFYRGIDCLLSLSMGEGFGKPILEAMACGVPTITTGAGGQMDFCNSSNSLWILNNPIGPVQQEQVQTCGQIYQNQYWAYPDIYIARENIKFFAAEKDGELVARLRENCIRTAELFTWDRIAQHIIQVLES